ncbi:zinc finger protein 585A-like [Thalassophryne amazonica]|uniref:zinc finger protein 585A-like n=1 Tax=Thalassophryne amazonica TaxID=390379 RepID=UPI001470CF84|nr:zinc finger protein 585A-like [Thalassophryne amazonica]
MSTKASDHGCLPLSSLRLIVSPLQLMCAALWDIVKQGAVMYYGLLEDFFSTVLEAEPELLADTEKVQLLMGLRARVVVELCRSNEFIRSETIEPHLARMNAYVSAQDKEASSSEVTATIVNFLKLVHTLLDDPCQRYMFYEKMFPSLFGPKYDSALQALTKKFVFNLQHLLPVPDLEQTRLWLSLSPSILKECVELTNQPELLKKIIHHHKCHRHEVSQALSDPDDDCILSSLSYTLPNVDDSKDTVVVSVSVPEDAHRGNSLESGTGVEGGHFEEVHPEIPKKEDCGKQNVDPMEDQGASVEVILPPDESDSYPLESGSKSSPKGFKHLFGGQNLDCLNKLKKHKVFEKECSMKRLNRRDCTNQSSFFERINLHPKTQTTTEAVCSRSDNDIPSLANTSTDNISSEVHKNLDQSNDDSLVCSLCGKVYTYQKNFDKHQKTCAASSKGRKWADSHSSMSLPQQSNPGPVEMTKESLLFFSNEADSYDSSEKMSKKSSRLKTCSACGQTFTCASDLTSHTRTHTEPSAFICPCGNNFSHYEDCKRHQESKCKAFEHRHANKELPQENVSDVANKRSEETLASSSAAEWSPSNPDAPLNSQRVHVHKSPLTCQQCGQSFIYSKSFEKHRSKCSQNLIHRRRTNNYRHVIKDSKCFIVGCDFRTSDNTHENTPETKEGKTAISAGCTSDSRKLDVIKCTMCKKNISGLMKLKKHYFRAHEIRGSYPCSLCNTAFVKLSELIRHQQNKNLYQCTTCKKCFTKPRRLFQHEKSHTTTVPPCTCETCGQSFRSLPYLILHQRKHKQQASGTQSGPSDCSYCGKQFSSLQCLKAHMVRHTGGYPCQICGQKFYQKTYLKWHLYKHAGQDPYLCDTCGKGWPSAAQLKVHMVKHSEERPYKCEDCGVSYKRQSHVLAHRRAKHIGLRPFVCEVCNKAYRLNGELKRHMMVHTGERPFSCPICSKTFTRKSRLQEHREKACLN